jgi:hypothetical protein
VERRIVLLSSDPALVSVAGYLLQNGNRMDHFASPAEVADWSDPEVAAVVLDSQARARRHGYKLVRQRYRGPLIMVLDRGDRRPELPPDIARRFLYRPFKVADLATLLAAPQPQLGPFEDAVITAWTRHASTEPPRRTIPRPAPTVATQPPRQTAPRHAPAVPKPSTLRSTAQGRLRVWAATVTALLLLLLLVGLSNRGSCGPGCANLGGVAGVAGASESPVPLTAGASPSRSGSGAGGGQPPGSSTPAPGPAPVPGLGVPLTAGVGGLIDAISPITATDTAPPAAPNPLPGVPPPTTAPPTTAPPTTAPPTTAPPTTAPPTTAPPTTAPPTTDPPTTAPPTTDPPTTAPPTTDPPTTDPPTTAPPATDPPTTAPPTTV